MCIRDRSRRVVGIAAGHGRAVLPPDLARDVPVPVIGVAARDLAFPVRDLFHHCLLYTSINPKEEHTVHPVPFYAG